MRILILTCATGGGHLRAAAALEKYIRETTTRLSSAASTKRQIKIIPLRISSPTQQSFWRSSFIRV